HATHACLSHRRAPMAGHVVSWAYYEVRPDRQLPVRGLAHPQFRTQWASTADRSLTRARSTPDNRPSIGNACSPTKSVTVGRSGRRRRTPRRAEDHAPRGARQCLMGVWWTPGGDVRVLLPAGLLHTGQFAGVRHLAQADAAQPELAVHRPGTAALVAARVGAHLELRLALGLVDQCLLCHLLSSP